MDKILLIIYVKIVKERWKSLELLYICMCYKDGRMNK